MKEFDIYLNKRLTECDIYLKERLTECDIIVYSIPYRDGLTVMDRLVLAGCIAGYTLCKFVAIRENNITLSADIDKMIKFCVTRLQDAPAIAIDQSLTEITKQNVLSPAANLQIASKLTDLFYRIYQGVQSAAAITASVLGTELLHFIEGCSNELLLSAVTEGEFAEKYEKAEATASMVETVAEYAVKWIKPKKQKMTFGAEASFVYRRPRYLRDMDIDALSEYDDMEIENVDYITI